VYDHLPCDTVIQKMSVILHSKSGLASVSDRNKPNIVTARIVITVLYCQERRILNLVTELMTSRNYVAF
jgi:hypothetical protein